MSKTSSPPKRARTPSRPRTKPAGSNTGNKNAAANGSGNPQESGTTIQVVVRLRPINEREKAHGTLPVVTASSQDKTVTVVRGTGRRQARSSYAFDNVFSAFTTQEEVFDSTLRPILRDVMLGFESTVFAYGQTGTGKTHTMEGELSSADQHGVIPRSAQSIFETLSQPEYNSHTVTASCLEIYNEELCDLFATEDQRKQTKVEIMEGKDGICCRGQVQMEVDSAEDVLSLMKLAQQFRKSGETKMNKHSSRSHCIFTLQVNAKKFLSDGNSLEIHGKLHLVDLAGSECAKSSSGKGTAAKRERERSNINRSLLTLGRVILMLKEQSENTKKANMVRIPYRDSKLTRLLQKSLGGKCKTLVIATLSPSVVSIEESVSTLNYAQSANGIVNKPIATSYLSINTNGAGPPTSTSEGGASEGGQSLEHWYEMECRLQYMQTQVDEAQAALARNHMVQQEITDRAERAEKALGFMEEKYEEAAAEVKKLNEEVKAERDEKLAIALSLSQTELELKKTSTILDVTQKNEVSLTAEANALIDTLKDSLKDGDKLHQDLIDTRDADVQRRLATKKFHSATVSVLEDIMSTLNELNKKEEAYCNSVLDSADKENKINHSSLDLSLELVKDINSRVKELTSTIKSHVHDEDGVLPLLSKVSEGVQDGVHQSKGFLEGGEELLSTSFLSAHKQLETQSSNLKRMDAEYAHLVKVLLVTLDSNSTKSKDKILNMVSSINEALSNVREANFETRTALEAVISRLDSSCTEASIHMEVISKGQSVQMNNAIEQFTDGMKHTDSMRLKLNKQAEFLGGEGSAHVNTINTQNSMLTSQRDTIINAREEQLVMKEQFLSSVLNGVRDLVNEQMNLFSNKQQEHLTTFEDGTESILEKNGVIGSSADHIIRELKEVNQSLSSHAEEAETNDLEMKSVAEGAKMAFDDVRNTSKRQQGIIKTCTDNGNLYMGDLSTQDDTVGVICETIQTVKNVVVEEVSLLVQDEKKSVSQLTDASTKRAEYTSNTIITSISSNLEEMEKPRKEVIANVTSKLDYVISTVTEGKAQIETVAAKQCALSDKLRNDVESQYTDHNTRLAKRMKTEFDACKGSIIDNARDHFDVSASDLSSSLRYSATTKSNIQNFATTTMEYEAEVPHVPDRKSLLYSTDLSATPSSEIIVQRMEVPAT